jgi:putative ABC transport system ATP-binding protein
MNERCALANGASRRQCVGCGGMNLHHDPSDIQHKPPKGAGAHLPLMRLTGVGKLYDKGATPREALRSVNLDIHKGEFTAIVGPSGAGKSALMKLLGLLEAPSSGGYQFLGVPESSLSADQRLWLRRRFFGFVPQAYHLQPSTSVQGNVALPLIYRSLPAERCQTAAMRALSMVGLDDCGHKRSEELTSMQLAKAAIARALVCNPSVLLVDESSLASDQPLHPEIGALLRTLNTEREITVVMVAQKESAAHWARRVIHVHGGEVEHDTCDLPH